MQELQGDSCQRLDETPAKDHPRTLAASPDLVEGIACDELSNGLPRIRGVLRTRERILPESHRDILYTRDWIIELLAEFI